MAAGGARYRRLDAAVARPAGCKPKSNVHTGDKETANIPHIIDRTKIERRLRAGGRASWQERRKDMGKHLKIDYVEFPSTDIARTKAFFSEVFGWSFVDYGPKYTAISEAGIDGGFYLSDLSSRTEKGAALIVFYSVALEETRECVVAAGGSIVEDIFEFPGGRRFHFTEPSGSEFAVWTAA